MKQDLSRRQTLEQMRAKEAWQRVTQIKEESRERLKKESKERQKKDKDKNKGSLEKEYRSRVRSLNAMIQINGLGSTLGFLKAKSEFRNAPYLLLEHLTKWMIERNFISASSDLDEDDSDDADDTENLKDDTSSIEDATKQAPQMNFEGYDGILNWVIGEANRDEYRRATTECLAFGLWLRRFAEAELEGSSPQALDANAQQTTENENSTSTPPGESIAASNVEGTEQHG